MDMSHKLVRGTKVMAPTTTEVIVHEPTVSIKVETLFSQVNNKMEQISRDISNLVEMGHKKADKTELEKVETELRHRSEKIEQDLSRRVSDLEKTTASTTAVNETKAQLTELGRSYKMHWISTGVAILLGLGSIIATLLRH